MSAGLRRFVSGAASPPPSEQQLTERCEMCAEAIGGNHGHVVDLEGRGLMCTCRNCALLFTVEGAGAGRFRAVPERYQHAVNVPIAELTWESIGIPVSMAFFFTNSAMDRTVAFYPSPAGATESLLSLESWEELIRPIPSLAELQPDVEALLVHRHSDAFEFFVVPIDACYELVGLVRTHWRGFDGGEEAWTAINEFFETLRQRSEPLAVADD